MITLVEKYKKFRTAVQCTANADLVKISNHFFIKTSPTLSRLDKESETNQSIVIGSLLQIPSFDSILYRQISAEQLRDLRVPAEKPSRFGVDMNQ